MTNPATTNTEVDWRTARIFSFDLETSGVDPKTARIVTACIVADTPQGVRQHNWLLDPGIEIPEGASNVHGITTERARAEGQDYETGLAEIRDVLLSYWMSGGVLVVFNAAYDVSLMHYELMRVFGEGMPIGGPILDPLTIDKAVDKFRKGSRKLTDMAAFFGIELKNAHSADADAIAAARIAWKMRQHPDLQAIPDIMAWQKAQRVEQQTSLAKYFARQGKDVSDISTDWPIVGVEEG